jgi:hypothetical protein
VRDRRLIVVLLIACLWGLVWVGVLPTNRGAYPPAPSLAAHVSAARQHFIDRVDQTCARTFNAGNARQARYAEKVARRPDARVLVTAFYVSWHTDEYRQLRALGDPPEARTEYAAWIDNFGERVRLESGYVPFMRAGGTANVQALEQRVTALKETGNRLGQRFGLRVCTSNGPR